MCVCVYMCTHIPSCTVGTHGEVTGKSARISSLYPTWDLWDLRNKFRSSDLSAPLLAALPLKKEREKEKEGHPINMEP